MWGHKVYTIYSILFIVFIILIIVTAFITIALTYFQLAVEDHRWAACAGGPHVYRGNRQDSSRRPPLPSSPACSCCPPPRPRLQLVVA